MQYEIQGSSELTCLTMLELTMVFQSSVYALIRTIEKTKFKFKAVQNTLGPDIKTFHFLFETFEIM